MGEDMGGVMDAERLRRELLEELVKGWEILPTGNGFVVASDWVWPTGDRIEVMVRNVGEREDLFLVSDGGELFNFFFAQGLDISSNEVSMRGIEEVAARHGAKLVDFHLAKGSGENDLSHAIRHMVECVKEGAFLFWLCRNTGGSIH